MKERNIITKYEVIEEYHGSWTSVDKVVKYFDTESEVELYVEEVESHNISNKVPEFYTTASYKGKVKGIEIERGDVISFRPFK